MTLDVSLTATVKWNFSRTDKSSVLSFKASNDTYNCPNLAQVRDSASWPHCDLMPYQVQ